MYMYMYINVYVLFTPWVLGTFTCVGISFQLFYLNILKLFCLKGYASYNKKVKI